MRYKEITKILLKKLLNNQGINCYGTEREKTCKWNKKVKYSEDGDKVINWDELDKICSNCLLKDIENIVKE